MGIDYNKHYTGRELLDLIENGTLKKGMKVSCHVKGTNLFICEYFLDMENNLIKYIDKQVDHVSIYKLLRHWFKVVPKSYSLNEILEMKEPEDLLIKLNPESVKDFVNFDYMNDKLTTFDKIDEVIRFIASDYTNSGFVKILKNGKFFIKDFEG